MEYVLGGGILGHRGFGGVYCEGDFLIGIMEYIPDRNNCRLKLGWVGCPGYEGAFVSSPWAKWLLSAQNA